MIDRESRFVLACATGPLSEDEGLIAQAVATAVECTHHRPLAWFSDGWHSYPTILKRAYREPVPREGRPGRRRWVVPETVSLMQTIKHHNHHVLLLSAEIRMVLGTSSQSAGTVHVERFNGVLRDRLNAFTRETHAFAKRDATWDALVNLQLFDHHFHRAHHALRRERWAAGDSAMSTDLQLWLWG